MSLSRIPFQSVKESTIEAMVGIQTSPTCKTAGMPDHHQHDPAVASIELTETARLPPAPRLLAGGFCLGLDCCCQ